MPSPTEANWRLFLEFLLGTSYLLSTYQTLRHPEGKQVSSVNHGECANSSGKGSPLLIEGVVGTVP